VPRRALLMSTDYRIGASDGQLAVSRRYSCRAHNISTARTQLPHNYFSWSMRFSNTAAPFPYMFEVISLLMSNRFHHAVSMHSQHVEFRHDFRDITILFALLSSILLSFAAFRDGIFD
jgi:hypothetical protein